MASNADALRALVSEIHRSADTASAWNSVPPHEVRARIRTLAREALALLPAEDRAPTCATCRHQSERKVAANAYAAWLATQPSTPTEGEP